MNIFFISDFHFNHNRDFIFNKRGFTSIEEHDEKLIENFNSKVGIEDVTYFIGDFVFGRKSINDYIYRLNGKFHFIKGNHDKTEDNIMEDYSTKILSYTKGMLDIFINKQPITLCHFPMLRWEKSHFGAWHLFGHLHSDWCPVDGKVMNVSVDALKNFPVSWDEVARYMNTRAVNPDFIKKEKTNE